MSQTLTLSDGRTVTTTAPRLIGALDSAEATEWDQPDALAEEVPDQGSHAGFRRIQQERVAAGFDEGSISTMRQYRDTAVFWPEKDRFPRVSFGSHKAAKDVGNLTDAKRIIRSVLKDVNGNPKAVTVRKVRDAVRQHKIAAGIIAEPQPADDTDADVPEPTAPAPAPATEAPVPLWEQVLHSTGSLRANDLAGLSLRQLQAMQRNLKAATERVDKAIAKLEAKQNRPEPKQVGKAQPKAEAKPEAPAPAKSGGRKRRSSQRG